MKKNRLEKGITLIALAITIIVLMIIAFTSTYTGINTLRQSKENSQISELNMLKQVIIENYTKYVELKNDAYIKGTAVEYSTVQNIVNEINSKKDANQEKVTLKVNAYTSISTTNNSPDYYYELTPSDFESMGASQVTDTYIVNYRTGEVINKEKLVTYSGVPLYTYAVSAIDTEDKIMVTANPNSIDEYTTSTQINIDIQSTYDISEKKYTWTNILNEPEKEAFIEDIPTNNTIVTPSGVKGNYYLWIYVKDIHGNESITSHGGYMIKN